MRPTTYVALRRLSQCATILFFCLLPIFNSEGWREINGSLFAINFYGFPFADPAAAAQVLAVGSMPEPVLLWGAVVSLLIAVVFGRIFCSWLCPYGFFSELAFALRKGRDNCELASTMQAAATTVTVATARQGRAFTGRIVITLAALACTVFWGYPLLLLFSMPGELSLVPVLFVYASWVVMLGALALPVVVLALEVISGKRLWCRYVCPQSVFLGLAARVLPGVAPGLRLGRRAAACSCKRESPCASACSLALEPRRLGGAPRMHCTLCGDCLKACSAHGNALYLSMGSNGEKASS